MNADDLRGHAAKVPAITLGFWLVKILATTLGETGGDSVSMTLNWGYLAATALFAAILLLLVWAHIAADRFRPWLYWATIVASTTAGTTLADFATRSLGIGYPRGSLLLLAGVLLTLAAWQRTLGTVSVASVSTPRAEAFTGPRSHCRKRWAPRSATGQRIRTASAISARQRSSAAH